MLPLRGGPVSLALDYDLNALAQAHRNLNATLEQSWAALLTVICERWPDWPVEVWSQVVPDDESKAKSPWKLSYRIYFAGEGQENPEVTAIASFLVQGLGRFLKSKVAVEWSGGCFDWRPLWAIDDARVFRLLVPEQTLAPSLFLVGHYGGLPSYFASTVESWPLADAGLAIGLADVDTEWSHGPGIPH